MEIAPEAIYSAADTSALFDLPTRDTFLAQEQISFQGGALELLMEADGSYGEFNGRADGSYSFVRSGPGDQPIPEPGAALVFAVGLGLIGVTRSTRLARA